MGSALRSSFLVFGLFLALFSVPLLLRQSEWIQAQNLVNRFKALGQIDNDKPVKTVDGWNAWFYDDLQRLKDVWPGLGRNKMSVAELWLGFLSFYAVEFDDIRQVICTRMSRPLSKFEKMWNSPCIAIEDPFDLSHNLGAGISRRSKNIFQTRPEICAR